MIGVPNKGKRVVKDPAAVQLAHRRSAKLSRSRREEIARGAALARWAAKKTAPGTAVVPIEDLAAELTRDIPPQEWKRLPRDLIDQLDHYLYGWPRR